MITIYSTYTPKTSEDEKAYGFVLINRKASVSL